MKLSPSNVSNYLRGNHPEDPPQQTLEAFAKALDVPLEDLEAAARYTGRDPFEAHPSSDLLTPPQRTAVNEIIRLLAESNKGAAHDRQDDTEQGPEAGSTLNSSKSSSPDGGTPGRPGAPIGEVHELRPDQGKLQPPPPAAKSAAYEPDEELEGPAEARRSRDRGEKSQDDRGDGE